MPVSHTEEHILVKTQLPFLISVKPPSDFWKTNLCLQPAPSRSGPAAGTMQRLCRSSALHSLWLSSRYLRRHCRNFSALTASHFGIYNAPLWKWSWDMDPGHADVMFLTHNQDHRWVRMWMTAQEPSATSSSSVLSVEYNNLSVSYSRQGLKSVSLFEEQELKALFPWRCSLCWSWAGVPAGFRKAERAEYGRMTSSIVAEECGRPATVHVSGLCEQKLVPSPPLCLHGRRQEVLCSSAQVWEGEGWSFLPSQLILTLLMFPSTSGAHKSKESWTRGGY